MRFRIKPPSWMATFLFWLHRGEDIVLSILLILTLGIAVAQILLRNLMGTSIVWADILVRTLVLWLGMLGAMIATRENKHISIDLISRYLSHSRRLAVESVVSLFAGGVCAAAGYYSLLFVMGEYQAGEIAFAKVPAWLCESILPFAFLIISLRFMIQCGSGLLHIRKAGPL